MAGVRLAVGAHVLYQIGLRRLEAQRAQGNAELVEGEVVVVVEVEELELV